MRLTSTVKSDHILNLFEDVEGTLPHDKERILAPIRQFLAMPSDKQVLYMVGRRAGIFSNLGDMENPVRLERAEQACKAHNVTPENVDSYTAESMKRFI